MKPPRSLRRIAVVLFISIAIATVVVWFAKRPRTTWYARDADSQQTLKVLFIGNSLTYYHNMPGVVAEMFRQAHPDQRLKVARVTGPGFKLADHLAYGNALDVIEKEGPWDWIVLQEYGGLANFDPEQARDSLQTLAEAARHVGAQPLVYLDWHSAAGLNAESPLEILTSSLDLPCVPVADAWHRTREEHPEIQLQMKDGVHPTRAGAYLIALVFYSYLSGDNPVGLPKYLANADSGFSFSAGLDEAVARDLQSIVRKVVQTRREP